MEYFLYFENGHVLECYFNGDYFVAERYDVIDGNCSEETPGVACCEEGNDHFSGIIVEKTTRRKAYFILVEPHEGTSDEEEDSVSQSEEYADSETNVSERETEDEDSSDELE